EVNSDRECEKYILKKTTSSLHPCGTTIPADPGHNKLTYEDWMRNVNLPPTLDVQLIW
ncbi:8343_t:CDS:2, partial [Diversispora eburnea]